MISYLKWEAGIEAWSCPLLAVAMTLMMKSRHAMDGEEGRPLSFHRSLFPSIIWGVAPISGQFSATKYCR